MNKRHLVVWLAAGALLTAAVACDGGSTSGPGATAGSGADEATAPGGSEGQTAVGGAEEQATGQEEAQPTPESPTEETPTQDPEEEALAPEEDPDEPGLSEEERAARMERRRQRREEVLARRAERQAAEDEARAAVAAEEAEAGAEDAARQTAAEDDGMQEADPARRLVRAMRRDANGEDDGPWAELTLPRSHTGAPVSAVGLVITGTDAAIRVNGREGLNLRRGEVRPGDRQDDGTSGALLETVTAAAVAMGEREDYQGPAPLEAAALLFHGDLPFATAMVVIESVRNASVTSAFVGVYQVPFSGIWSSEALSGPELRFVEVGMPQRDVTRPQDVERPRLLVEVRSDGFLLSDLNQSTAFAASELGAPIPRCSDIPTQPTICLLPIEDAGSDRLVDQLDYRALYNRLFSVRHHEAWASDWPADSAIFLTAAPEVPWEAVLRVAEVARFELGQARFRNVDGFRGAAAVEENPMFPRLVFVAQEASTGANLVADSGTSDPTADSPPPSTDDGATEDGDDSDGGGAGLRYEDFSVQGSIVGDAVERLLRRHRRRMANCMTSQGATEGTATVRWNIDESGQPNSIAVSTRGMGEAGTVTDCLIQRIGAISFPEPSGGIARASITMRLGE